MTLRPDTIENKKINLEAIKAKYANPGELSKAIDDMSGRLADELLGIKDRQRHRKIRSITCR